MINLTSGFINNHKDEKINGSLDLRSQLFNVLSSNMLTLKQGNSRQKNQNFAKKVSVCFVQILPIQIHKFLCISNTSKFCALRRL